MTTNKHTQCPQCDGLRELMMTVNRRDIYYCDTCERETVVTHELATRSSRDDEFGW